MTPRLLVLLLLQPIIGFISAENYIRERTYLKSNGSQYIENYQLFDGFGRPIAEARGGMLPSANSLVGVQVYDVGGRKMQEWLPVPASCPSIFSSMEGLRNYYYTQYGDSVAYTLTSYDGLDRVTSQRSPGTAWKTRPEITEYRLNAVSDSVRRYSVPLFGTNLVTSGFYAASQLRKEVTIDPDQHRVTRFIDQRGHMILERKHDGQEKLDTYYIYDVRGQLRVVLSPEYQRTQNLGYYAYQYQYDQRGRCNYKKLPGCGAEEYWYDSRDRLIAMQDSVLRSQGRYRVYTYDALNRLVEQGISDSATGVAITQEQVYYYTSYDYVPSSYSSIAAPITGSVNHQNSCPARLTGLRQQASNGSEILTIIGYDSYQRRNRTQIYGLNGLMSEEEIHYDFYGAVDSVSTTIRRTTDQSRVFRSSLRNNYYNIQNTKVLQSSNLSVTDESGQTQSRTIQTLGYDALGHVTSRIRGNNAVNMVYQYNSLRGWLTQISTSGNSFRQILKRESGTSHPLYNGSISAMEWYVGGEGYSRQFQYDYDGLNRLKEAIYSEEVVSSQSVVPASTLSLVPTVSTASITTNKYGEKISYDWNGNITRLQRRGILDNRTSGLIDNLTITYTGNQRKKVTDSAGSLTYDGASDFVDGSNAAKEYSYDGNGRLTMDLNRGITTISYDQNNNPQSIIFNMTNRINRIQYVYSPDGTKLRTIHVLYLPNTSLSRETTDYIGNLVMKDGHLSMYHFDGGYVSFNNTGRIEGWYWYIKDYMGNNRMVVNNSGVVVQTTHYYPYGGVIGDISTNESLQKYKFEGKELDRTFGLDWYDIHARQYDAIGVPSWNKVDAMAEKYYHLSPYVFAGGDPVNYGDYDGNVIVMINGYYPFSSETGNARYWHGSEVAKWAKNLNQEIIYRDGSIGSKVLNYGGVSLNSRNRYNRGVKRGEKDAAVIIDNLMRDENGNTIEPIIVFTHSMGAAYAKGYLTSIMDYAKDTGIDLEVYEFDFAPHQPTEQTAVYGVYTFQISHSEDDIVNNSKFKSTQGKINGAVQINSQADKNQSHSINSFRESVNELMNWFKGLTMNPQPNFQKNETYNYRHITFIIFNMLLLLAANNRRTVSGVMLCLVHEYT